MCLKYILAKMELLSKSIQLIYIFELIDHCVVHEIFSQDLIFVYFIPHHNVMKTKTSLFLHMYGVCFVICSIHCLSELSRKVHYLLIAVPSILKLLKK